MYGITTNHNRSFAVNRTSSIFHIGRTNIEYKITFKEKIPPQ
jgi:hypothetical protein